MSEKKVLEVIQIENFLKYIRKKRAWVCFICNGVDVHMVYFQKPLDFCKGILYNIAMERSYTIIEEKDYG